MYICTITIDVPVVFMARYVMILKGATSLRGALEGVGPENRDFFRALKWHERSECHLGPKKLNPAIRVQISVEPLNNLAARGRGMGGRGCG